MGKKDKLDFYGGEWFSFIPFIVFIATIILTTFVWRSISNGALWLPAFFAIVIAFFFAKDKQLYSEVLVHGMSSREAITPILCWFFAGVFSKVLSSSGLALAIAGFSANLGVGPILFLEITFIASALFATATGTGFGTIATAMGVLYPAGISIGCYPELLAGVIISGAVFGDNLAPVSDTTICSATTQGVDVPGVVRSRLKYAAVAGTIAIVIFAILGSMLQANIKVSTTTDLANYDPKAFFMLLGVVATLYVAFKTGDIVIATTWGIVISSAIGLITGQFDFLVIDSASENVNALINVSGAGLDREVGGILYDGLSGMLQVSILALLLFGSIAVMRAGGGDIRLLNALGGVSRTAKGSELVISGMVILLSGIMGLNAPAILAVGSSFAKPLGEQHGISPYRIANVLDAQSNTLAYLLPWTPAMVFTISFAAETSAPLIGVEVSPFVIYPMVLLVVMTASIFIGIGRKDGMNEKQLSH
ncbi:MAG: Na+/H+ antiporter NhaC family protein [Peptoniphilus sp.]|nr:Na+/H+ antiporter NhaC family protein [Peptoniphilus sp.]MDD7363582.1 Na+/H+ antiporter NhaC family protein [Bacillota bacterium]MDY6045227.1 Na+/H+ antiporter NhaC family protein [Peptoniphilus sp.]